MTNDGKKENLLNEKKDAHIEFDRVFTGFLDRIYEVTRPEGNSRDDDEDSGASVSHSED
jgi:hypothetical protein